MSLIIFEGAEGTGKTSLSKILAQKLGAFWSYEPYGEPDMPICESIRRACLSQSKELTINARELMLLASRSMSLEHLIRPQIDAGKTVILDRSFISGMVYSKIEGIDFLQWSDIAFDSKIKFIRPDIVVMVTATEYRPKKGNDDRYDGRGEVFFKELERLYDEAISFCFYDRKGIPVEQAPTIVRFKNDMNIPIEKNVESLEKLIFQN